MKAVNPLREGLARTRTASPTILVLFGVLGDLSRRKIVPAVAHLARNGLLPPEFALLGVGRVDCQDEAFREDLRETLTSALDDSPDSRKLADALLESFHYFHLRDDDPDAARAMADKLASIDAARGTCGARMFYLSTPPSAFFPILDHLGKLCELSRESARQPGSYSRIIIEKPFGHDLESAVALNRKLLTVFDECDVYRIDHYLGKETVQNVLVLRFANAIFEPLWNRRYIDNVQITVAESLGVEGRGGYYDGSGALRDMVQNHLMQLLCLVAMEAPATLDPESIRDERRKVLRSMRPISHDEVPLVAVRGQSGPGSIGGRKVAGYREDETVDSASNTETYAAVRLEVDNWRWAGVPFFLRTGKRLPKKVSEVAITFRDIPHRLFDADGRTPFDANVLSLRIQPDEGIALRFGSKVPGHDIRIRPVKMDFLYGESFGAAPPDAYERLLLDAMLGDPTLFIRGDIAEDSWQLVMPILDVWRDASPADFPNYAAGAFGPRAADELLEVDKLSWRRL